MKPKSAPGQDGFTVKFLRTFWPLLAPLIIAAVNEMKKTKLTTTLRTTLRKLLQKGNKDSTNPNSFQPISLLSVIYKMASCAISNRLKRALPTINGKQQNAYVGNDNIGSYWLNLLSTLNHCNQKN